MSYFIIVGGTNVSYGEEGAYEYSTLEGVIGPFDTKEAAWAHDKKIHMKFDSTEVVKLTAPGEEDKFWENKYA